VANDPEHLARKGDGLLPDFEILHASRHGRQDAPGLRRCWYRMNASCHGPMRATGLTSTEQARLARILACDIFHKPSAPTTAV
jgi:hypothetical protein